MPRELIIGLTEHRTFGHIFQAFLIEKKVSFYSIEKLVKDRDIEPLSLNEEQSKLVKLIEQYSDEKLIRKFSKKKEAGLFFQKMDPELFENQISPYIDRHMNQIVRILMKGTTRLFHKQVKYSNLYEEDRIAVPSTFAECTFLFDRSSDGTRYRLEMTDNKRPFSLLHKKIILVSNEPCSLVWQNKLVVFDKISAKKIIPFLDKEFIFIPSQMEEKYYGSFVLQTIREYPVKANGFTVSAEDAQKQAILSIEHNLKLQPSIFPVFFYGETEFLPGSKSRVVVSLHREYGNFVFRKIDRDVVWEKNCLALLKEWGLKEENGCYSCPGSELMDERRRIYELICWFDLHREELNEAGFRIRQDKLQKRFSIEKPEMNVRINLKDDWFDIYANVNFGKFQIPFIKLRRYILNDIHEFELPNGETAIIPPEWFSGYRDLLPFARQDGNSLKVNKHHYDLLRQRLKGIDKSLFQQLEASGKEGIKEVSAPHLLQASLRSYQQEGYSWMYHLFENRFGGCLADDMGLGKTLQTLTLLLKLKKPPRTLTIPQFEHQFGQIAIPFEGETAKEQHQPASLIVVPTSLVHNWETEIQKFTPSLKTYKHTGIKRKKTGAFKKITEYYDIILTTFGTVRNDFEMFRQHSFFYLILDESQNIKNPASKTYQAVSQLNAQYRLALTGTPIENSLADLWAQMNFLNKGLLGNLAYFKREFINPIEKKNDPDKQSQLQLLIRPFVLRRTKDEVARDLPSVTEQTRYCPMGKTQLQIYEKEKSAIRNSILENIEREGTEKSAFIILQGLTRLRQLANHPSLLSETEESESGKFDEIMESLESLIAEKHKVLIFSSFVRHLELVKEQIISRNWKYSMLTGQTVRRELEIKEFQENPENRIFLISLKAGGVGLNLTAADYVFIIDPWWNPAAELQAISRAHRIGQDKKVFVYRFITEGTIEEKIQSLQERKSSLAEKFIHSNNPFKAITKDEILNLLK
ncbi:MAG: DEAD/DEAH box helicase [Prolixibacteraceae bacterium]